MAEGVGRISSYLSSATAGGVAGALAVVWDLIKRVLFATGHEDLIPGGDALASRPSAEQLEWAWRGYKDAFSLDAPYMGEMRWRFVISDLPHGLEVPPPAQVINNRFCWACGN